MSYLRDLPMFSMFCDVKPIRKGMSGDKKYYITTTENQRLLLRVSDPQDFQRKQTEYWLLKQFAELKIPMLQPVDFGIFGEDRKVYTLLTWIDGEDAETEVPRFSEDKQYQIGREAGEILKSIHSIPANAMDKPWKKRYFSVISERLAAFLKEGERFPGWEIMMDYIDSNRNLLDSHPQVYHHGDYYMGNLSISPQNELSVIDWHTVDFDNIGDLWYEFNRIGMEYPCFAAGQIDGYFRDVVNLKCIERADSRKVTLCNGLETAIGRTHRNEFEKAFFIGEWYLIIDVCRLYNNCVVCAEDISVFFYSSLGYITGGVTDYEKDTGYVYGGSYGFYAFIVRSDKECGGADRHRA